MSLTDNLLAKYRELHPPPPVPVRPVSKALEAREAILANAIKAWTPNWDNGRSDEEIKFKKKYYMKADDFFTNSYKADDLLDL